MPRVRRKIALGPGGPLKDAERVDVQQSSEQWNEYLLADGSVIRLKAVVTDVWQIVGEYDKEGNPVYVVNSRNVVTVTSPDELMRKSQ